MLAFVSGLDADHTSKRRRQFGITLRVIARIKEFAVKGWMSWKRSNFSSRKMERINSVAILEVVKALCVPSLGTIRHVDDSSYISEPFRCPRSIPPPGKSWN